MLESLPVWLRLTIGWAGVVCLGGGVFLMWRGVKRKGKYRRLFKVVALCFIYALLLQIVGTMEEGIEFGILPLVDYRVITALLIACVLADRSLTKRGLYLGAKELNPIGAWMIKKVGHNWASFIVILFILGVGAWMSGDPEGIVLGYALLFVFCLVLPSNAWTLRKLRRKRARALVVVENNTMKEGA